MRCSKPKESVAGNLGIDHASAARGSRPTKLRRLDDTGHDVLLGWAYSKWVRPKPSCTYTSNSSDSRVPVGICVLVIYMRMSYRSEDRLQAVWTHSIRCRVGSREKARNQGPCTGSVGALLSDALGSAAASSSLTLVMTSLLQRPVVAMPPTQLDVTLRQVRTPSASANQCLAARHLWATTATSPSVNGWPDENSRLASGYDAVEDANCIGRAR